MYITNERFEFYLSMMPDQFDEQEMRIFIEDIKRDMRLDTEIDYRTDCTGAFHWYIELNGSCIADEVTHREDILNDIIDCL